MSEDVEMSVAEEVKNAKSMNFPWLWKAFKNSARNDELELYHWMRADIEETDYRFAKCNKHVDIPNFTDKEYDSFLVHSSWTKEETKCLLDLCQQFDLRWPVITDRYSLKKRSMEELKDRYYEIIRKLCRIRQNVAIETSELKMYDYNIVKEVERKKHLESLYKRTLDEIREEEYLVLELKRLEKNRKKLERERESLLRLLNGTVDVDGIITSLPMAVLTGRKVEISKADGLKKLKRKKSAIDIDELEGNMPPSPATALKRPEKLVPGPYLQSQRLLTVKAAHVKHVERILLELGIRK
jgi:DNA methyltransferase 1-associated protein 1